MKRIVVNPGDNFGRLTIVEEVDSHSKRPKRWRRYFLCQCECGKTIIAELSHLRTGHTTSCGCLKHDVGARIGRMTATHGQTGTPTFKSWDTMRQRCNNPNDKKYRHYGGRGIVVCERWSDFENFLADMGEKPDGMTIDRIDNDGNYEPGNCRWATLVQQARNKRNNVMLTYQGNTFCLAEWAVRTGLTYRTIHSRYKSGWPAARILTTPSRRSIT